MLGYFELDSVCLAQSLNILCYDVFCDIEDKSIFSLLEAWGNPEDLEHLLRSDGFGVLDETKSLLTNTFEICCYRFRGFSRRERNFQEEGRIIMYLSLIITFLLLLLIIITAVQNSMPLDFKFFTWNLQLSITAIIFYSALIGGAIVAVLALPKLAKKSLYGRSMNREIRKLKEKILELGKKQVGGSQTE